MKLIAVTTSTVTYLETKAVDLFFFFFTGVYTARFYFSLLDATWCYQVQPGPALPGLSNGVKVFLFVCFHPQFPH